MRTTWLAGLLVAGALASCQAGVGSAMQGTSSVMALGETSPVGSASADAADDPAIWRNPRNPAASLIVATDKKAGLYVYGLDGRSRSFAAAGRLNNVDLADLGERGVIVVASDRNDPAVALFRVYRLDTAKATLLPLGAVPGGKGEAYGVCLWRNGAALHAFSVLKDGTVEESRIDFAGPSPTSAVVRSFKLASQAEGCVADPRDGTLYVGEEDVGIWRFAPGANAGELVARADGSHLVADVEGLALAPQGKRGGLLVASSQGDNAYALYRLPEMTPAGRFRIVAGRFGATEETDGIAIATGDFGPGLRGGLFVAQDGVNGSAQNFKFVSWAAIQEAVGR
jgi:3-phytase